MSSCILAFDVTIRDALLCSSFDSRRDWGFKKDIIPQLLGAGLNKKGQDESPNPRDKAAKLPHLWVDERKLPFGEERLHEAKVEMARIRPSLHEAGSELGIRQKDCLGES